MLAPRVLRVSRRRVGAARDAGLCSEAVRYLYGA
jgi:hypothetical protein